MNLVTTLNRGGWNSFCRFAITRTMVQGAREDDFLLARVTKINRRTNVVVAECLDLTVWVV